MNLSALSHTQLLTSLKGLVAHEREVVADIVAHLAEVDRRKLYLEYPCPSLSAYCVTALGYSEYAAAHRVTAARLVRKYPLALAMLRRGELHLAALRTLAPVLTDENHEERLRAAVGCTRDGLERMVAGWSPKPDVPSRVVAVQHTPAPELLMRMHEAPAVGGTAAVATESTAVSQVPALAMPVQSRPARLPKPLSPERYRIEITVDRETRDALMRARDHLRHVIPDGDIAKVITRAVNELLAKVEARKFGKRKQPPAAKETAALAALELPLEAPRGVPDVIIEDDIVMPRAPDRATRREVAERDDYCCSFVGEDGRRCSATAFLEYDHVVEWALHGPTFATNLRLLCRGHHRAREHARRTRPGDPGGPGTSGLTAEAGGFMDSDDVR